ncbi:MAG: hypothetical protein LM590_05210 [Thermofilum sp.]|nr:hypothetical protein [Thermofilum sp.]
MSRSLEEALVVLRYVERAAKVSVYAMLLEGVCSSQIRGARSKGIGICDASRRGL